MEGSMAVAGVDDHMNELLEDSGSMAAEVRGAHLREPYPVDVLLVPEADFIDDHGSAHSNMEVADRLTYLEQRIQMQEDEIQLLKMALADVLKRLNISEEQTAALTKRGSANGNTRPLSLALPIRSGSSTASTLKKSASSTLPSSTSFRNYSPSPSSKSAKDNPSVPAGRRTPALVTTVSTCKKQQESKSKEASASVIGIRRVTHCKVTMQIYLSPLAKRTGSTKTEVATAMQPNVYPPASGPPNKTAPEKIKAGKSPVVPLKQKSPCQSPFSPTNTPSYKSPIKSPSHYFQICY